MTVFLALVLVSVVAFAVALPLLRSAPADDAEPGPDPGVDEWWNREKAIAMLAIREADFDRATGKLTEDDFRTLRSEYEDRALRAMEELDKSDAHAGEDSIPASRFCGQCGGAFSPDARFCGTCGAPRHLS